MDFYNLNIDPFRFAKGLEEIFHYEPIEIMIYETKKRVENKVTINADLELQPFEIRKKDIVLKIIPYTINDANHNPRLVKTIKPNGISEDELGKQLNELHQLGYI